MGVLFVFTCFLTEVFTPDDVCGCDNRQGVRALFVCISNSPSLGSGAGLVVVIHHHRVS